MKISILIILTIAWSSFSAAAELLQQANIVAHPGEPDRRGGIVSRGPELGMSPAEILRARRTTGYIKCPGTDFGNGGEDSGAMIGDGGQIVTNAHTFIDERGNLRSPLSQCYFLNQEVPATKQVMFDFSPGHIGFLPMNHIKMGPTTLPMSNSRMRSKIPLRPRVQEKSFLRCPLKLTVRP